MPQVHNKSLAMQMDNSAFSKTSRYMSTIRVTEGSKRKIRAFNTVESRLNRYRINFYNRHAEIEANRRNRERERVIDALRKRAAYKFVIKNHTVSEASDYQKALNDRYSQHALRHEIRDMLIWMSPDKVRERQAHALIDENRKRYDGIIKRTRDKINVICPPKTDWRQRYYSSDESDSESEDEEDTHLSRAPTKATLPIKRQGITKSFMLQSGISKTEIEVKKPENSRSDSKTERKSKYDLPPVVDRSKMTPSQLLKAPFV